MPARRAVVGRRAALRDDAQGADICADRRHGRRADDVAAGTARRRAQLGLPLLLAARRHPGSARRHERRLFRRSTGLARMAVAGGRRQSGPVADHVRHRRRAAADRMDCAVAARLRKFGAGAHRQCRSQPASARRLWRDHGRSSPGAARADCRPTSSGWEVQLAFLEHLQEIWKEPDEGIWEVRGAPQHFTHSKVMAWVAFDRAIKSAETFGLEGPLDEWRELRDEIFEEVCAKGFDPGSAASCSPMARSNSTPACC